MELPDTGLGTAHLKSDTMLEMVETALLRSNIRHIDCAKVYGNEQAVGDALENIFESGEITRKEVFITSKLWNDDHRNVEQACRDSLARLKLKYLDLYLIHWPVAWRKGTVFCPDDRATLEQTWHDMERLVDLGLTKRIGVSNFDKTNLRRILNCVKKYRPYANQLEIHPRLSQRDLVAFNHQQGVKVIAWSPLAKFQTLSNVPELHALAERKQRSVVQLVLRWHFQHGVKTIPRSSKPARIQSNAEIFDFELSADEMRQIDSLNLNRRLTRDWIGVFDTTPYFPFKFPIGLLVAYLFRFLFFFIPNRIDLQGNPFNK